MQRPPALPTMLRSVQEPSHSLQCQLQGSAAALPAAEIVALTSTQVGSQATSCSCWTLHARTVNRHGSLQVLRSQQALRNSGIVFGAAVTPLPTTESLAIPHVQRLPAACAACGAYLHLYCKVALTMYDAAQLPTIHLLQASDSVGYA